MYEPGMAQEIQAIQRLHRAHMDHAERAVACGVGPQAQEATQNPRQHMIAEQRKLAPEVGRNRWSTEIQYQSGCFRQAMQNKNIMQEQMNQRSHTVEEEAEFEKPQRRSIVLEETVDSRPIF